MNVWTDRLNATPVACAVLLASLIYGAEAHGETSHGSEVLVQSERLEYVALDMAAAVFVVRQGTTLFGHDVDTGVTRWSFALDPEKGRFLISSGKSRLAALYPEEMVVVLDTATGQEAWRSAQQEDGDLLSAQFVKRSDWLALGYRRAAGRFRKQYAWATFLHDPEGVNRYRVPDNYAVATFSPSGEQLGLWTFPKNELVYWDFVNDLVKPENAWPSEAMLRVTDILANGAALALEVDEGNFMCYILKPKTAPMAHPVGIPGPFRNPPQLLEDRRRILILDADPGTMRVYDGETQEDLWTIRDGDHTFIPETLSADSEGRQWILSRDYLGQGWLWPVEPEGHPRKILDASAHNPRGVYGIHYSHVIIGSIMRHEKTRRTKLWARKLEDMSVTSMWEMAPNIPHDRGLYYRNNYVITCAELNRCMVNAVADPQKTGASIEYALVHERDNPAPLLMVQGRRQTLSPDGRHAVISSGHEITVYHVDTETSVIEVESKGYAATAFSMDSNRIAVYGNQPPLLSIWRLDKDYQETACPFPQEKDADRVWPPCSLSFSADGSLLLAAGQGRARLYDAESGTHLRTFTEPRRFIRRRPSTPHVLGVAIPWLVSMADFAGRFTNRFKRMPQLNGGFLANDRHVFTVAEGRLLRVWDMESGRSLQTIEPAYPDRRSAQDAWISNSITLSENGDYAFFANKENKVGELWEIGSRRQLRQYLLQEHILEAYIPDDGSCVYISDGRSVKRLPGKEAPEKR